MLSRLLGGIVSVETHFFSLLIQKMAMTRKERDEYAKNAYIYVIEECLGDKIGGNIDKALTQAGCQGDMSCCHI